jgi:hypothetical protein
MRMGPLLLCLSLCTQQLILLLKLLGSIGETAFVWSAVVEKHELSQIDFELIDDAFKALLQFGPDPVTNIVFSAHF